MVQPIGRIVSRLSKDVTTLDNQLPTQMNQLVTMVFSVFGTVGLVIYTFPLLGIIFVPMLFLYWGFATFYRASSREVSLPCPTSPLCSPAYRPKAVPPPSHLHLSYTDQ